MPPVTLEVEQWRGYGWDGYPFQAHPAEGIVAHHAVIEPSGDLVADLQLVDRIHGGAFLYTIGGGYGAEGWGRGPYIGGHTLNWNTRALGYVFLTDGRYHSLTYQEIECFRWWRQWCIEQAWVWPEHFVTPHGWMPGNSTACCGPLIIDQLPLLLAPYEGSFEVPPEVQMIQTATFRAAVLEGDTSGKVYGYSGGLRFHIVSPDHWVKLVNWGLVLNYDVLTLTQLEFDSSIDVNDELQGPLAALVQLAGAGGGGPSAPGISPAEVRAIVREELDKTVVRTDEPLAHLGT